jgi:glycosyltransferase involved in cell wall biosynthesis
VPYLIKDGINGLIYKKGDIDELYRKVEFLMQNPCEIDLMGKQAYNTIKNHWNPQNAAERFVELAQAIINKDVNSTLFEDGICSKAEILKDG